jgi:hypothetical protein
VESAGCPLLCLLGARGEASRVARDGRWCVGGWYRLPAALPAALSVLWRFLFLFFYFFMFFSTDGILEESETPMAY